MRTLASLVVLMVAVLWQINANADSVFKAVMTGDQENPPVDTVSTGRFKLRVNDSITAAEFSLTVNDGTRVQQAHIHCGPPGVNGTIIIFLAGNRSEGWDVDGEWVSNTTITDANVVDRTTDCGATLPDIIQAMIAGNTYANAHTVAHPGGEVRGQILPVSCPSGGGSASQ